MTYGSMVGSIPASVWRDRLEATFHGPRRARIFHRLTIGRYEDFRFIFGCSTIGADPRILRGHNGDA